MIERLRIRDLAIVEQAEIAFGPGLNALTGETGAGKSIVLGALALLAGARADARSVREGADEALVEAVFRTARAPALEAALRERGLEAEGDELIVARSVSRAGRSRASVGGRLVPVSVLAELFGERLEISSQHESQRLRRPESHGLLLDAFAGLLAERAALARGYEALRALRAERAALQADEASRARRRDFLAFQVGEIDAAGLAPGELEALGVEHARLAHAEDLRAASAGAAAALVGDAGGSDAPAALDLVAAAAAGLAGAASFDPRLAALAERARGAHAELADLAREVERYADTVDVDPGRRAELEERLATLERLRRKYGRDETEILALREALGAELATVEGGDQREAALATELAAAHAELAAQAAALGAGRAAAAARLARDVEERLRRLEMPDARVEVALVPVAPGEGLPCGPVGAEQAELLLSANRGEAPRPLRQIASGGELSRVFLAIQGALRRTEGGMVLVFDEVDAGIGGRTAERVGQALAELAGEHQVLCITHLPQVAALAATQLRVAKQVRGGRTVAAVEALDAAARVEELARMAGGARVTEATRQHARELLRAQPARSPAAGPEPPAPERRARGRRSSSPPPPR